MPKSGDPIVVPSARRNGSSAARDRENSVGYDRVAMVKEESELERSVATELDRGAFDRAAEHVIRGYGPQILGYLCAVLRDQGVADDAFSQFCEDLWKGIAGFRRESSIKTWSYSVAWNAAQRVLRDPYRRRGERLQTSAAIALADEVRSLSSAYDARAATDRLAKIRERLAPDEQTLLILRFDRDLTWKEIAQVVATEEATVRKRFERLTAKLRKLAEQEGLLDALPRSRGSD
jgi:RNA polymerase sigma-70 factor (ECF subfamily)